MDLSAAKRILVIGCPGSGKSTLASQLAERLQLPLIRLDEIQWVSDDETLTREVFDQKLVEVLDQECWVMDGNYGRTLPRRLERAELVIWLDFPRHICLYRVIKRYLIYHGRKNPLGNPDHIDFAFLQFIWNFDRENQEKFQSFREHYKDRVPFEKLESPKEVAIFRENYHLNQRKKER